MFEDTERVCFKLCQLNCQLFALNMKNHDILVG